MEALPLVCASIPLEDYPCYSESEAASTRPGVQLCEHHFIRGVRYGALTGYAATTAYFYLWVLRRSSFSDRLTLKLHHYFYGSAGYTAPIGGLAGLAYGTLREAQGLAPAAVERRAAREREEAASALHQYNRKRDLASARLEDRLARGRSRLARLLGVGAAGDREQRRHLQRLYPARGLEDMYPPLGLLWVRERSLVNDPQRYASGDGETAGQRRLTKAQTDALVSRAMQTRLGKEESRWQKTASRFGLYGIITMLLFWNSGGAFFRFNMGMGAGVALGAVLSASRIDESLPLV